MRILFAIKFNDVTENNIGLSSRLRTQFFRTNQTGLKGQDGCCGDQNALLQRRQEATLTCFDDLISAISAKLTCTLVLKTPELQILILHISSFFASKYRKS